MEIHISQDQRHLSVSSQSIKKLVVDFLTFSKVNYDEVSIHLVDTSRICELHAQFFNDPSPTDCISFPMDSAEEEGYRVMGEVFVCPETATQYVAEQGGEVYQEITLYLVHGLLHLLGYDDIEEMDRQRMRLAEANYLAHVEKKQLWLTSA